MRFLWPHHVELRHKKRREAWGSLRFAIVQVFKATVGCDVRDFDACDLDEKKYNILHSL